MNEMYGVGAPASFYFVVFYVGERQGSAIEKSSFNFQILVIQ